MRPPLTIACGVLVLSSLARAQTQFRELERAHVPPSGSTVSLALGDVDGDGDADLLSADGRGARLCINDGSGVFAELARFSTKPTVVGLSDLDGDGDLDALAARNGVEVFWNVGLGSFGAAPSRFGSRGVFDLAAGDVDADGDTDVVLAEGRIGLFLNAGGGSFVQEQARLPGGSHWPRAIALADVDRDGDLDLLGHGWATPVVLYLNDGAGTFSDATPTHVPAGIRSGWSMEVTDVDGDADVDLYLGTDGGARLLLNDGTGRFVDASANLPPAFYYSLAVHARDLDGDGDQDIVTYSGTLLSCLVNSGSGVFTDDPSRIPSSEDLASSFALADVDGDGDADFVGGGSERDQIFLNDGAGTFFDVHRKRLSRASPGDLELSAVADVDLDRHPDLLLVYDSAVELHVGDGYGWFREASAARLPPTPIPPSAVRFGDADGDGDPDLVTGRRSALLFLNDGTGKFTDATAAKMPALAFRSDLGYVRFADIDGDRDLDLLLRASGMTVLVNDGTGAFADETASRMLGTPPCSPELADIDGDGDLDLMGYGVLLNDGTGRFLAPASPRVPSSWFACGLTILGDVDGDGDVDAMLGVNLLHLLLNDGQGFFADVGASHLPPPSPRIIAAARLGDVDDDADPDVLLGDADGLRLWINDGAGRFQDATASRLPPDGDHVLAVELLDADGDGDLDAFAGSYARPYHRFYVNLDRHVDAPLALRLGHGYELDVHARPGYATAASIALPFLAASAARLAWPPFGTLGLDPLTTVALPPRYLPPTGGAASLRLIVPPLSAAVGRQLYAQVLVVDGSGRGRLSNVQTDVVLR